MADEERNRLGLFRAVLDFGFAPELVAARVLVDGTHRQRAVEQHGAVFGLGQGGDSNNQ